MLPATAYRFHGVGEGSSKTGYGDLGMQDGDLLYKETINSFLENNASLYVDLTVESKNMTFNFINQTTNIDIDTATVNTPCKDSVHQPVSASPSTALEVELEPSMLNYTILFKGQRQPVTFVLSQTYGPTGGGRIEHCAMINDTAIFIMDTVSPMSAPCHDGCLLPATYDPVTRRTLAHHVIDVQSLSFTRSTYDPSHSTRKVQPDYSNAITYYAIGEESRKHYLYVVTAGAELSGPPLSIPYPPSAPLFILRRPPGGHSTATLHSSNKLRQRHAFQLENRHGERIKQITYNGGQQWKFTCDDFQLPGDIMGDLKGNVVWEVGTTTLSITKAALKAAFPALKCKQEAGDVSYTWNADQMSGETPSKRESLVKMALKAATAYGAEASNKLTDVVGEKAKTPLGSSIEQYRQQMLTLLRSDPNKLVKLVLENSAVQSSIKKGEDLAKSGLTGLYDASRGKVVGKLNDLFEKGTSTGLNFAAEYADKTMGSRSSWYDEMMKPASSPPVNFMKTSYDVTNSNIEATSTTTFDYDFSTSNHPTMIDGDGDAFLIVNGFLLVGFAQVIDADLHPDPATGQCLVRYHPNTLSWGNDRQNTLQWLSQYDVKHVILHDLQRTANGLRDKYGFTEFPKNADDLAVLADTASDKLALVQGSHDWQHFIETANSIDQWTALLALNDYGKLNSLPWDGLFDQMILHRDENDHITPSAIQLPPAATNGAPMFFTFYGGGAKASFTTQVAIQQQRTIRTGVFVHKDTAIGSKRVS